MLEAVLHVIPAITLKLQVPNINEKLVCGKPPVSACSCKSENAADQLPGLRLPEHVLHLIFHSTGDWKYSVTYIDLCGVSGKPTPYIGHPHCFYIE